MQEVLIELKNGWKGKVTVEVPLHHERMMVIADVGAGRMMGTSAIKSPEDRAKSFEVNMPILGKVYDKARKLIQSVDLKGPDDQECKDQQTMETHPDLQDCWIILASQYLEGFGPGKKKSRR
jgi:hypothetical protein